MKRILSLLIVCVLIGCSEKRVLIDELTNKGTKKSPTYYSEDGLFNGVMYDVNPKGVLVLESTIKDGKLNGLYKEWYENGELKIELNYINGVFDGLVVDDTYDVKFDGNVSSYNNKLLNGDVVIFYPNQNVQMFSEFKNGIPIGKTKLWYENGELWMEGNVINGLLVDGIVRMFYWNGQLEMEENYKNNVLDGLRRGWDTNGQLKFEQTYDNGELIEEKYY